MMFPTVHLNGTSASALLEENLTATHALRTAISRLKDAAPNARDYYPQGNYAIEVAVADHRVRVMTLEKVLADLEKLSEYLADQEVRRTG